MKDLPISEIKTGFEGYNDELLVHFPSSDITTGDRIKLESNRRLKKSIDIFNATSSKQTTAIIWLTIAMLIVGLAQIGLLLYSLFSTGLI